MPGFRNVVMLLLCVQIVACSGVRTDRNQNSTPLEKLVSEKIGSATTTYNSARSYALCLEKPAEPALNNRLKFVVVRLADMSLIYEGSFMPGHVEWISATEIEVLDVPGTIRADETLDDYKKTINLLTIQNKP